MSHVLDVKGLNCPLPVLRTKKAMKAVPKGEVLTVEATDPNTPRDVAALCEASGFALLSSSEQDGVFVFKIQHAA
jgi:Predicted redox protein, regulator of disulfide bond formation